MELGLFFKYVLVNRSLMHCRHVCKDGAPHPVVKDGSTKGSPVRDSH
jgi:hypothetical protein